MCWQPRDVQVACVGGGDEFSIWELDFEWLDSLPLIFYWGPFNDKMACGPRIRDGPVGHPLKALGFKDGGRVHAVL